jgi:hypothetical protein
MRTLALALCLVTALGAPATCDQRGYCPSTCTRSGATETDGLALLDAHVELLANIGRAVDIMRTFPGVNTDDRLDIHTTFQYLCCVTPSELLTKVFPALDAVQWAPVNISYSRAVCNKDGSIILMADEPSQAALGAVVAAFEAAIERTGVAVVPRASMEGFHMTIGTTNASYPMAQALEAINAAIPEGTWTAPFALKNFAFLCALEAAAAGLPQAPVHHLTAPLTLTPSPPVTHPRPLHRVLVPIPHEVSANLPY